MHAVATGAVGHRLRAGFRRQAVEGGVKADQPVGGKSESLGELDVAVATTASLTDVGRRSPARKRWCGWKDGVLAVTIGAQRRLRYPVGKSFAMNAA